MAEPSTGETQRVRVVLVDDQQLVRAGFRMVIDSQPDLTVVGEAADGQAALDLLATTPADVVLMDVRMPRLDGIEATRRIGELTAPPRVVVLTTFDLDEYVLSAIAAGASGFLLKDAPPEEMLDAVRTVAVGDAVMAASATRRLLRHVGPLLNQDGLIEGSPREGENHGDDVRSAPGPTPGAARLAEELTPREHEVFVLMAHGLSNSGIAAHLVVSEATVKTHVGRVLTKTGSRDRVQAVVLAYRLGVVLPEDVLVQAVPGPHPQG